MYQTETQYSTQGTGSHHAEEEMNNDNNTDPMLQYFEYAHLKVELQQVSRPFAHLAAKLVTRLPRCPMRTVALQKLREAKDAAVTASFPTRTVTVEDLLGPNPEDPAS